MQRLSTIKLTLLGLVLLATSAVIAAVLPSKAKEAIECDEEMVHSLCPLT